MRRRALLAAVPALLLAGCAGQSAAQRQGDVTALAAAAQGFLAALAAVPGLALPATVTAAIQAELAAIQANAAAIATALTPADAAAAAEAAAEAVGALLAPFFPQAQAAVALADALVSLAQIVVADLGGGATVSATAPRYVPRHRYGRAQARAILGVAA